VIPDFVFSLDFWSGYMLGWVSAALGGMAYLFHRERERRERASGEGV
jgi:hypothetical protein